MQFPKAKQQEIEVIRGGEPGKRGARWHKVTLDFFLGLRLGLRFLGTFKGLKATKH